MSACEFCIIIKDYFPNPPLKWKCIWKCCWVEEVMVISGNLHTNQNIVAKIWFLSKVEEICTIITIIIITTTTISKVCLLDGCKLIVGLVVMIRRPLVIVQSCMKCCPIWNFISCKHSDLRVCIMAKKNDLSLIMIYHQASCCTLHTLTKWTPSIACEEA